MERPRWLVRLDSDLAWGIDRWMPVILTLGIPALFLYALCEG